MGESVTLDQALNNILTALDTLYERKLRPFMQHEGIPHRAMVQGARMFIDLKCDVINSARPKPTMNRLPYDHLKQRFRDLEQYMRDTLHQGEAALSGKDAAAGERRDAVNG